MRKRSLGTNQELKIQCGFPTGGGNQFLEPTLLPSLNCIVRNVGYGAGAGVVIHMSDKGCRHLN